MLRPCLSCGTVTKGSRCAKCQSERNRGRGSAHARGYTRRWTGLSRRYRRFVPYCELRYEGCQRVAVDVDHTVPLRAGGRSVWANCTAVCRPCHARKTAEDRERYSNAA
jgi:5-methylcytosine-specific restriction protein A